jgi:hypothetical protein
MTAVAKLTRCPGALAISTLLAMNNLRKPLDDVRARPMASAFRRAAPT